MLDGKRRRCVQIVKMKGRVACEISTCECLIATQAIFEGLFSGLSPSAAAALLSSLVNQHKLRQDGDGGKPTDPAKLLGDVPDSLKDAVSALHELTNQLGVQQVELQALDMPPHDYVTSSIRPSLTAVRFLVPAPVPATPILVPPPRTSHFEGLRVCSLTSRT